VAPREPQQDVRKVAGGAPHLAAVSADQATAWSWVKAAREEPVPPAGYRHAVPCLPSGAQDRRRCGYCSRDAEPSPTADRLHRLRVPLGPVRRTGPRFVTGPAGERAVPASSEPGVLVGTVRRAGPHRGTPHRVARPAGKRQLWVCQLRLQFHGLGPLSFGPSRCRASSQGGPSSVA